MNPASTISCAPRAHRCACGELPARSAARLVRGARTAASAMPSSRAQRQAGGVRAVRDHEHRLRRAMLPARQARAIATMLEPRPEIRMASRSGRAGGAHSLDDDAAGRRARTSPMSLRCLAVRVEERDGRRRLRGRHDDDHADAAVEGAVHLGVGRSRRCAAASRTPGRAASCGARARTSNPSGSTRGMLSVRPPPVMCARPCTGSARISASSGLT